MAYVEVQPADIPLFKTMRQSSSEIRAWDYF